MEAYVPAAFRAHGFLIEQDRDIAEKSGKPPAKIKSITHRGPAKIGRMKHTRFWDGTIMSAYDTNGHPLLVGRQVGMMHIVCYLRQGSRVFETYWTTRRGVEAMDNSYRLLDLTVYGRQEAWEDSPAGWPQQPESEHPYRIDGRPIVHWPRLKAGYSDDLGTGRR